MIHDTKNKNKKLIHNRICILTSMSISMVYFDLQYEFYKID